WVAVIPLTREGDVVLVQQYRHGLGRVSCELPAGVIDAGETPEQAARRELSEETGYVAEALSPMFVASPEPHRSTARAHFFFAANVSYSGASRPEPSEVLEVTTRSASLLVNDALSGRIDHAAHIGAILWANEHGLFEPKR
ncbi:MAG TPA: NUDIX hydrolase, partial [Polyangiaceae bacterium]